MGSQQPRFSDKLSVELLPHHPHAFLFGFGYSFGGTLAYARQIAPFAASDSWPDDLSSPITFAAPPLGRTMADAPCQDGHVHVLKIVGLVMK